MRKTNTYKIKIWLYAIIIVALAVYSRLYYLIWASVIILLLSYRKRMYSYLKWKRQKKRYLKSSLCQIDKMTGVEFENYLRAYFEAQGYAVMMTPVTNDYGADLILRGKSEKIAVQAKCYAGKVGNKAIQEINTALKHYKADRGIVVTNSYFTRNAVVLAEENGVELWDRDKISNIKMEKSNKK